MAQYHGPDVVNDLTRQALHPYLRELAIVSEVGARSGPGAVVRDIAFMPFCPLGLFSCNPVTESI